MNKLILKGSSDKILISTLIGLVIIIMLSLTAFLLVTSKPEQGFVWTQDQIAAFGVISSSVLVLLIWFQLKRQTEHIDLLKQSLEPDIDVYRATANAYVVFDDQTGSDILDLTQLSKENAEKIYRQNTENWYTKLIRVSMMITNPTGSIIIIYDAQPENIVKFTEKRFTSDKDIYPIWTFDTGETCSIAPNFEDNPIVTFTFNKLIPLNEAQTINVALGFKGKKKTTGLVPVKFVVDTVYNDYRERKDFSIEELKEELKKKYNL